MFKNREIRIKVVKADKNTTQQTKMDEVLNPNSVQLIEEAGRRFVTHLAVAAVAVGVIVKAADTLGEIAVNAAPKR